MGGTASLKVGTHCQTGDRDPIGKEHLLRFFLFQGDHAFLRNENKTFIRPL